MAIAVICPQCFKRFQVSERFAGLKGPCPNCKATIDIPKANVTVHAPEEVVEAGKVGKKRIEAHPIRRLELDFSARDGLNGLAMVAGVVLATWFIGWLFPTPQTGWGLALKYIIAIGAMTALCIPISAFGYQVMRDQDTLFVWMGRDLYMRSLRLGGAYAILWIAYEIALRYTLAQHNPVFIWVVLVPFAVLAAMAAVFLFDFDFTRGLLHTGIAFVAILFLRGLFGLGWLWNAVPKVATISGGVTSPWP